VTKEILVVAGAHLAQEGAVALSLRSIARDLGMVPSALYRYFAGRDALLSALILSAYTSLADEAEQAADDATRHSATDGARWAAVPLTMRRWALARPHEWGLLFGSPVPDYRAPEETVVPYARLATALVRPVAEAYRAGRLRVPPIATGGTATALDAALAPVREALLADAPSSLVLRVLQVWCALTGSISLELFGHWRNTVLDTELFFEQIVSGWGEGLGLTT
jgi:AcrR family transcriptional regulator